MEKSGGLYTGDVYGSRHPTLHVEDSAWKATQIIRMLERNSISPSRVCEVGCGAGEILRQLHDRLDDQATYVGYEISPRAYELCQPRVGPRLEFKLQDFLEASEPDVDLLLLIDVVEHVENYLGFLRRVRSRSELKLLHIPLDLSVEWLVRSRPLIDERRTMGHVHFFSKDLAMEVLRDSGYEVLDWFYTRWGIELFYPTWGSVLAKETPVKTSVRKVLQHTLFWLNQDLCARLTRGWSLLVLAR